MVSLALSYNQPKFCPNASWNPNATTFANNSTVGTSPYAIFVDSNNTVVVARQDNGEILIWRNNSINPTTTIFASVSPQYGLFVTGFGEILIGYGSMNDLVDRWIVNNMTSALPLRICSGCAGLFVDIDNNLHCSQYFGHKVLRTPLNNVKNTLTIVAGIGCPGSTANMLNQPYGILRQWQLLGFISTKNLEKTIFLNIFDDEDSA